MSTAATLPVKAERVQKRVPVEQMVARRLLLNRDCAEIGCGTKPLPGSAIVDVQLLCDSPEIWALVRDRVTLRVKTEARRGRSFKSTLAAPQEAKVDPGVDRRQRPEPPPGRQDGRRSAPPDAPVPAPEPAPQPRPRGPGSVVRSFGDLGSIVNSPVETASRANGSAVAHARSDD